MSVLKRQFPGQTSYSRPALQKISREVACSHCSLSPPPCPFLNSLQSGSRGITVLKQLLSRHQQLSYCQIQWSVSNHCLTCLTSSIVELVALSLKPLAWALGHLSGLLTAQEPFPLSLLLIFSPFPPAIGVPESSVLSPFLYLRVFPYCLSRNNPQIISNLDLVS